MSSDDCLFCKIVAGDIPANVVLTTGHAVAFRDANTSEVSSYDELRQAVERGGFAVGSWCGDETCEQKVKAETKATIRFLPLEREDPGIPCTVCGNAGVERATWAVAY